MTEEQYIKFFKIPGEKLLQELLNKIKAMGINYNGMESRVKSFEGIIEKSSMEGKVPDIAGLRIITEDNLSIFYSVVEKLKELQEEYEIINNFDYVKNPKPSGYKAYHIYLRKKGNLMGIEIQIMTPSMVEFANRTHEEYKEQRYSEVRNGEKAK